VDGGDHKIGQFVRIFVEIVIKLHSDLHPQDHSMTKLQALPVAECLLKHLE
jgi:hypothetical protein